MSTVKPLVDVAPFLIGLIGGSAVTWAASEFVTVHRYSLLVQRRSQFNPPVHPVQIIGRPDSVTPPYCMPSFFPSAHIHVGDDVAQCKCRWLADFLRVARRGKF
jgi:hypothetical protein